MQNTIIEAANENFAMAADHINHLYLQVRNRVFGNPGAANEPEAFGRPSGALGKTGFLEFLNARMPNLDRQERNDVWRITGEIMNLTIDDMHNETGWDGRYDLEGPGSWHQRTHETERIHHFAGRISRLGCCY